MPDWKQLVRERLARLQLAPEREAEIVEELALDLEQRYAEALSFGAAHAAALQAALDELENSARVTQAIRDAEFTGVPRPLHAMAATQRESAREIRLGRSGGNLLASIWQDLRYGLRMLAKNPGFTLVAVLTLALGIGANTAIFSVLHAVVLRPISLPNAERIVHVTRTFRVGFGGAIDATRYEFWRDTAQSFSALSAHSPTGMNLSGNGDPQRLHAMYVTANYFEVLGVPAARGRTFSADEDRPGGAPVAVLSDALWRGGLGAAEDVVGRPVLLDGLPHTVIGVMPAGFAPEPSAQIWVPLGPALRVRGGGYNLTATARLRDGVTLAQAQAEMRVVAEQFRKAYPKVMGKEEGASVRPYKEWIVEEARPILWMLFGAVGFVLLIACGNVANLLLARAASRSREIAVRTALGAGRARLVSQLLTESVLLAVCGGAVGLLFANWGLAALLNLAPDFFPRMQSVRLDIWALAFTLGVSCLTGLLFGLAPVFQSSRLNMNEMLKEAGRSSDSRSRGHLRSALAAVEVGLSLVLLAGAGLMVRSIANLRAIDPGCDIQNVVTLEMWRTSSKYASTAEQSYFYERLLERIRAIPGVEVAAVVTGIPLERGYNLPLEIKGRDDLGVVSVDYRLMTAEYFRAMGIPVRQGRSLAASDVEGGAPVAMVNQAFVRRYLKEQDPLTTQIQLGRTFPPFSDVPREIVGVVGDVRSFLDQRPEPTVFVPAAQAPYGTARQYHMIFPTSIVVRAKTNPAALAPLVRREVLAMDTSQPLGRVRSMREVFGAALGDRQLYMTLLGIFAALAVALTAVGIYGVIAYGVSQRTREIGIRMALGAAGDDVMRMVLRQGLLVGVIGVAAGVAAAFGLTRFLKTLLFGVAPADPLTLGSVALLLLLVTLAASYIPARRATRVDPLVALRYE